MQYLTLSYGRRSESCCKILDIVRSRGSDANLVKKIVSIRAWGSENFFACSSLLQVIGTQVQKLGLGRQCDFRFGLFFRFSFRFRFANYFFVLVSF